MIILYDNNGTPILDAGGNLVTISGSDQVRQIAYNVLTTMLGEDFLNPDYGLDIKSLKSIPNISNTLARSIIVQAFNPRMVVGIADVNFVNVDIRDETLYLQIGLVSEEGETVEENISLGV